MDNLQSQCLANFQKLKVALDPIDIAFFKNFAHVSITYPANQTLIIKKGVTYLGFEL